MSAKPRTLELNAPTRRPPLDELRQHLINASNELYLFETLCVQTGQPLSAALQRAHAAIRAEMKRLEQPQRAKTRKPSEADSE